MRLVKNSDKFGDFRIELEGDEAGLIAFYDAADHASTLNAVDVLELLRELRAARQAGLSRADYWAGPPDGALH